jgi:adhesin transport system membrane fusion protein
MPRTIDRSQPAGDTSTPMPTPLALRRTAPRYVLSVQELEDCPPPATARAAVLLALALVGGFLAWSSQFPVAERVVARGEIIPAALVQPVQAAEGGRVAELLVRPGERVAQGQTLLRLDRVSAVADLSAAHARQAALALAATRLAAAAEGRIAGLGPAPEPALAAIHGSQAAMADASARLRAAQLDVLDAEIAGREATASGLAALPAPIIAARDAAGDELQVLGAMLDRGLARRNEVFQLRQAHFRSESEVLRAIADLSAARLAVAEARARREELAARARNEALTELVRVEADLAETRQARARAEARLGRLEIAAPVAGVLKEVAPRGAGAVLEPGGLVAEIVPEDGAAMAEVELPADQVGGIRVGQPARVRVLTYDHARYGTLQGTVEAISAASFRRPDGSAFFRVRLALGSDHLGNAALGLFATPGMSVVAEIVTGQRSLLSWLAKPVRNAVDTAFAER